MESSPDKITAPFAGSIWQQHTLPPTAEAGVWAYLVGHVLAAAWHEPRRTHYRRHVPFLNLE